MTMTKSQYDKWMETEREQWVALMIADGYTREESLELWYVLYSEEQSGRLIVE